MPDQWRRPESVSLFFSTGDFAEAYRRLHKGERQSYGTHDELALLIDDLRDLDIAVTVYSFMSVEAKEERIDDKTRIVSLGSRKWTNDQLFLDAVKRDTSDALIPHVPNIALVNACAKTGKPVLAGLASSYNEKGPKAVLERWRVIRMLRQKGVSMVTNHCWPSSKKLVDEGVPAEKVVPWDTKREISLDQFEPKTYPKGRELTMAFAGTIAERKGVGDILRALAILKKRGSNLHVQLAGKGKVEDMRELAGQLGVSESVTFLGLVPNTKVIDLFRDSDLVCVPSRHDFPEGFPLVMFEAIATRTPIVCSDHPMFRPIMLDGHRASVFKAQDPQSLADAIDRVLNDPGLYDRISLNAKDAWAALQISADWRTLILEWIKHGPRSEWLQARTMAALMPQIEASRAI